MEGSDLFANDGSFLERFKQLQEQGLDSSRLDSAPAAPSPAEGSKGNVPVKKAAFVVSSGFKPSPQKPAVAPNGKLAFSLKQKSKLPANPLKLGEEDDEDDDDGQSVTDRGSKSKKRDGLPPEPKVTIPPPPPSDPEVKKVADKLASFVVRHGRQFEDVTRQKNPGNTPFRFLFDVNCADYKYYNYQVMVEEKAFAEANPNQSLPAPGGSSAIGPRSGNQPKTGPHQGTNYQTPASALYAGSEDQQWSQQRVDSRGAAQATADSLAMMEFYMKKAAQGDLRKPPKRSRDEMPPPASLQAPSALGKKGHHMGDYIPPEELEKFLAKCNDAAAQKAAKEATERAKIQSDNVGHRLLSKMGWKEGEGLGSGKDGRADPVQAGAVKLNNLGVGAQQPGEVSADDDIYEQYKKRMMLGYRFRPNPLNNPRKAYY